MRIIDSAYKTTNLFVTSHDGRQRQWLPICEMSVMVATSRGENWINLLQLSEQMPGFQVQVTTSLFSVYGIYTYIQRDKKIEIDR